MKIFKFNLKIKQEVQEAIKMAIDVLKKGGIVIHPTDTCYGIAADINNHRAINNVYQLKGRNFNKPFFIITSNITQFKKFGSFGSLAKKIIEANSEKMHTFVVPRKKAVPDRLNPGLETIGIQIPRNIFSLSLLEELKNPVIGTSANVSGLPVVYSISELMDQLDSVNRYPDLILDAGRLPVRKPSTIIEIKENKVKILR